MQTNGKDKRGTILTDKTLLEKSNLSKLNQSAIIDSECPITKKRHNPNQCEFCFDKCCSTGIKRTRCNCLICAFRRDIFGIKQELEELN